MFSFEKKIILGENNGWSVLGETQNIDEVSGRLGYPALSIARTSYQVEGKTDLALDFETLDTKNHVIDINNLYDTIDSHVVSVSTAIMGKKAALCRGEGGIRLRSSPEGLFGKSQVLDSFTLGFWLNPFVVENGEILFAWDSSILYNDTVLYQIIRASFFNNHLEWNFNHIFKDENFLPRVQLKSRESIIPKTWAYHSISYDENKGIIEYKIDGKIQDIYSFNTRNGSFEGGRLGKNADLLIVPEYTGLIDDFYIEKGYVEQQGRPSLYVFEPAFFQTKPLGPFPRGSKITDIKVFADIPSETDVEFFIRESDNYYQWNSEKMPWRDINTPIILKGNLIQLRGNVYTDGNAEKTPIINSVHITYEETEPPSAPQNVIAQAGNESVFLSWQPPVGNKDYEYIVYYGTQSGEYFGVDAIEGQSPMYVGNTQNIQLTGLKNGTIYYFTVTAYVKNEELLGSFSREVYARPLRNRK